MRRGALVRNLLELVGAGNAYDLAQPYFPGMPHHPLHPPFLFGLNKKHGDYVAAGGASSASEVVTLGGHVGTHIDALCHFSCGGVLHGGVPAEGSQSYAHGLERWAVDTVEPILRRGVLLDVAGYLGVDAMAVDAEIAPGDLEAVAGAQHTELRHGDVVLLRTGWARFWDNPVKFVSQMKGPGPGLAGAQWLSARGIFAAGSDTLAFEKVPDPAMPGHVHLLVESGIHIIECLNLERLAAERCYEFLFVATPLKIRGGTGSPIRPIAIAE